ncbi:hypothetical protein ACI79J_18540 [Geodermatophilus sp. SYSU D01062]
MRTRTAGAVTLLLAAGALGTLTGTAAAAPPDGRGATTSWYATTRVDGGDLSVDATVTGGRDGGAVADVAVFLGGLRCVPLEDLDVDLVQLESAALSGESAMSCTPEGGQGAVPVGAHLTIDLTWTGTGDVRRLPLTGSLDHCVGRFLERDAEVTGSVTVTIEGGTPYTVTGEAAGDVALRWQHVACPPPAA